MKRENTSYLVFVAGALLGGILTYSYMAREKVSLVETLARTNTVASLVLDTDRWIWKTIDNTEDVDGWAQELKDRLEYIEMVIKLYSFEE